ncbi:hypothetical protein [Streptomyces sp. NPDC092307]|uniref:hypothetical protein n=1 Tax=Streptomyces sp. NPDC092307 TaxID=3366013 RepID=UPI00380BA3B3
MSRHARYVAVAALAALLSGGAAFGSATLDSGPAVIGRDSIQAADHAVIAVDSGSATGMRAIGWD